MASVLLQVRRISGKTGCCARWQRHRWWRLGCREDRARLHASLEPGPEKKFELAFEISNFLIADAGFLVNEDDVAALTSCLIRVLNLLPASDLRTYAAARAQSFLSASAQAQLWDEVLRKAF